MTNKQMIDIIKAAKKRIKKGWAKGLLVRKKLGNLSIVGERIIRHKGNSLGLSLEMSKADDGQTTDVCMDGAILYVIRGFFPEKSIADHDEMRRTTNRVMRQVSGEEKSVSSINDFPSTTLRDMVKLCDMTIEHLRLEQINENQV